MSNNSKKTHEPFFMMTLEQIKNDYDLKLLTTEAYIFYLIKALKGSREKMSLNARVFCQDWNIKESTFYRAIRKLKAKGCLELERQEKVIAISWGNVASPSIDSSSEEYIEFSESD